MKIAVIGAGISGISAAFHLQNGHDVTLIERGNKIGGHANSVTVDDDTLCGTNIDTGFIVFNDRNYPLFNKFLHHFGVGLVKTDMSFSYANINTKVGYAGTLKGLTPTPSKTFSLAHWLRIKRLYKYSRILASFEEGDLPSTNIVDCLDKIGCPKDVVENYFIPMASAIWSCKPSDSREIPSRAFVDFFLNHGLLGFKHRPKWNTVKGGSQSYLEAFRHSFQGQIKVNQEVNSVLERNSKVFVKTKSNVEWFDFVVIATHADTCLEILPNISETERSILLKHRYGENEVVLHTDEKLMPANKRIWASWNVKGGKSENGKTVFQTSYFMNRLQRLKSDHSYIVTVNPSQDPDANSILYSTKYKHPLLTQDKASNGSDFKHLNQGGKIFFCGSYFGYGFHEDGFDSGFKVAQILKKRQVESQ